MEKGSVKNSWWVDLEILLVSEDMEELEFFQNYIKDEMAGNFVYSFCDSREAAKFIEDHPVDLCFTNVLMKYVSGFAIAKEVREQNDDAIICFIADNSEYALDAWKCNVNDYIIKPVTKEAVMHALKNI